MLPIVTVFFQMAQTRNVSIASGQFVKRDSNDAPQNSLSQSDGCFSTSMDAQYNLDSLNKAE